MINENRIEYYYYYPYSVEIVTVSGSGLEECFFFLFLQTERRETIWSAVACPVVVS